MVHQLINDFGVVKLCGQYVVVAANHNLNKWPLPMMQLHRMRKLVNQKTNIILTLRQWLMKFFKHALNIDSCFLAPTVTAN